MKPICLKMHAFGPYRDQEIIDFNELHGHQLFVISGTTGAGKTTIFDAIFYALYGVASGEDRTDAKFVRSDFASDEQYTNVELTFCVREKTYRVFRQLAHQKAGNKSATGGKVELYEILAAEEIPVVDQQKITEVNKKIEEIIGLSKEQFKQIVMLPQGEFQKLLTSETENKEAILRKIFKTDKYGQFVERLKQKRDQANEQLQRAQIYQQTLVQAVKTTVPIRNEQSLQQALQNEGLNMYQVMAALKEEAQFYTQQIPEQLSQYNLKNEAYEQQKLAHHTAAQWNIRIEEFRKLQLHHEQLIAKRQDIDLLRTYVVNAKKAEKLMVFDEDFRNKRQFSRQKEQQIPLLQQALQEAQQHFTKVEQLFVEVEQQKLIVPKLEKSLFEWQAILPLFEQLEQQRKKVQQVQQQLQRAEEFKRTTTTQVQQHTENLQSIASDLQQLFEKLQQTTTLQQQLFTVKEQSILLKQWAQYKSTHEQLTAQITLAQNDLVKKHKAYEQLRSQWLQNRAAVLAQQLVDGEACPVCGATEHVAAHVATVDEVPQHILDQARVAYEQQLTQQQRLNGQLQVVTEQVQQMTQQATTQQLTLEMQQQVVTRYEQLTNAVNEQQQIQHKYDEILQQKQQMEQLLLAAQQTLQKAQQEEALQQQQLRQLEVTVQELKAKLPIEFDTKESLQQEIRRIEQQIRQVTEQYERIGRQKEQITKDVTIHETNMINGNKALIEAQTALSEAEQTLKEKVLAQFVDGKAFQEAQQHIVKVDAYTVQIQQYDRDVYATEQFIEKERPHLEGKATIDLQQLVQQVEALQYEAKQLYEQYTNSQRLLKFIEEQYEAFEKNADDLLAIEKQTTQIIELYDLIRGQNTQKISFERYLQIEYLEQIIHAANERLRPLSNGQFLLQRSERIEANRRQSGLGLDVYDAFTGMTRDVKTMSGGEKFNAALCLALGVSDIIQSYQGNVQIETMFIDEGFGTLDEEALNKAIDTLIELQKTGRMIGVISHVQELKQAMPAILEVKKTKEGYSKTSFIVK